jgi:hypothetical protein
MPLDRVTEMQVAKLGVTSVLVSTFSGMTVGALRQGLERYAMGGGMVLDYVT